MQKCIIKVVLTSRRQKKKKSLIKSLSLCQGPRCLSQFRNHSSNHQVASEHTTSSSISSKDFKSVFFILFEMQRKRPWQTDIFWLIPQMTTAAGDEPFKPARWVTGVTRLLGLSLLPLRVYTSRNMGFEPRWDAGVLNVPFLLFKKDLTIIACGQHDGSICADLLASAGMFYGHWFMSRLLCFPFSSLLVALWLGKW